MDDLSTDFLQLRTNTFNFSLQYVVSSGYTFTFTDAEFTAGGTGPRFNLGTRFLTWTVDSGDNSTAGVINRVSPIAYHNAIQIKVTARDGALGNSYAVATNLQFAAKGATACASLADMRAQFAAPQVTEANQWLVADADLSEATWTVTGQVELERFNGSGSNAAEVAFKIFTAALPDQAFTTCQSLAC